MHTRSRLAVVGLMVVSLHAAADNGSTSCEERFRKQAQNLQAGFESNRTRFDQQLDTFLTQYAAAHPVASKEDYRSVFDDVYRSRFAPMEDQKKVLLQVYEGVLDGDPGASRWCKKSDEALDAKAQEAIEGHRKFQEEILRQLNTILP